MKKQEIKRRKRIVPADGGTSAQQPSSVAGYSPQQRATQTPVFEHSVSPDPSSAMETSESLPPGTRLPVPVDFTTYKSTTAQTSYLDKPPTPSATHFGAPSPRKRSLSATFALDEVPVPANPTPHRPNAISSILNPTAVYDTNIDPSLSFSGPPSGVQEDKTARKERLQREAEKIREELVRRERELQELDED